MIATIAFREFRGLFVSLFGWMLLAAIQIILAYLFMAQIDTYLISIQPKTGGIEDLPGVTELIVGPLYGNAGIVLLMLNPLLTMRAISAERANRTLSLLITAPIAGYQIALGKYAGILAFNILAIAGLSLMPASLGFATDLDYGKLSACILALILLTASFAAVGLYISSLAGQPSHAASMTFGVLFLLLILDWSTEGSGLSDGVLQYISLLGHFNRMRTGLVSSTDVVFYLLIILVFLSMTIKRIGHEGDFG